MSKQKPWLPIDLSPQWPYPKRLGIFQAIRGLLSARWSVLVDKFLWIYYRIIYQTDDKRLIRCSLASERLNRLYRERRGDREQQRKYAERILNAIPAASSEILSKGTLEFHGWRELPYCMEKICFVSWTPLEGKNVYRMLVPLMHVLVRDKEGKDQYDPIFSLKEMRNVPADLQTHSDGFTPERATYILKKAFIVLANAIKVEEDARAKAL